MVITEGKELVWYTIADRNLKKREWVDTLLTNPVRYYSFNEARGRLVTNPDWYRTRVIYEVREPMSGMGTPKITRFDHKV